MAQNRIKRPRVAAIRIGESQIQSIAPLCGTLRTAGSLEEYSENYNWIETDITILGDGHPIPVIVGGNVLAIEPRDVLLGHGSLSHAPRLRMEFNTEREMRVPECCPPRYAHLAAELARQLGRAESPPEVFRPNNFLKGSVSALVETTSGRQVAQRCVFPHQSPEGSASLVLVLPKEASLSGWFRAFLADIHEFDPAKVPQTPPRLGNPADWYTPEERRLAKRIAEIEKEVDQLKAEGEQIVGDLVVASANADAGIRKCIWADGEDLVMAVGRILTDLGFDVGYMDAEQEEGKPKREDLRLALADRTGWEAIVEIKGYTRGTKTNDARQIREHRERYIGENGTPPDLTLWIANTHRTIEDPSSRPVPDRNVGEAAESIGAVHVLTTDLYRLWTLVVAGELQKAQAIQRLTNAVPGLWTHPATGP